MLGKEKKIEYFITEELIIMIEKFKIRALRTVKSPSDPNVTSFLAWVNMRDLPADLPTDVNPREVNMKTTTAKKLLEAVSGNDPYFDIHNRGIVILAKDVTFDSVHGEITLDLDDDTSRYGILDGGHTYKAIMMRRDSIPEDIEKYVKLEIFVGEDLDVSALSDARNTSVQVSDIALFNLEDRFDFIKDALKTQPYGQDVAYKDNENKRIPVADILKLMYAFNIERFPDDAAAPISAYSGKAAVFKDYKREWEEKSEGNHPTPNNIYLKLTKILPDLVQLYETIQRDMPRKYKDYKASNGSGAAFGKIRGIERRSGAKTSYTNQPIDYDISAGFLWPVFGAFRALLSENADGELTWVFDPQDTWEKVGETLVQNTFDTGTNANMVGKSKTLWQSNYRIVENEKNKRLLAELEQLRKGSN